VLDPVIMGKAEFLVDILTHGVGIKMYGIEARREQRRQRRFTRAGQAHD